jgi:hypothetical protein
MGIMADPQPYAKIFDAGLVSGFGEKQDSSYDHIQRAQRTTVVKSDSPSRSHYQCFSS